MKKNLPKINWPLGEAAGLEPFEIVLKFSRRRKTIGLVVTALGEVVVQAPQGTSAEAVGQAVARHRQWLLKKLAERREALARLEPGKAYYLGEGLRVRRGRGAGVVLRPGELVVGLSDGRDDLWPLLKAWYQQEAALLLQDRVEQFARLLKLSVGSVEIKEWRRRWGECHPRDGALKFNWRLVLLPLPIIDYVAAHELTHLIVPGHPPKFWQRLAKAVPDWAARRRWLNRYGAPFLLWRFGGMDLGGGEKPG